MSGHSLPERERVDEGGEQRDKCLLTQCPKCETIFRLSAADLAAAQGFVECGECATQFCALDRLADEPKFSSPATVVPGDHPTSNMEPIPSRAGSGRPTFVLMDAQSPSESFSLARNADPANPNDVPAPHEQHIAESRETLLCGAREFSGARPPHGEVASVGLTQTGELSASVTIDLDAVVPIEEQQEQRTEREPPLEEVRTDLESLAELARDVDSAPTTSLPESEHAILFAAPGMHDSDYSHLSDSASDMSDVPSVLRRDIAALERPRSPLRGIWITIVMSFCVALMLQVAWLLRAEILAKFPTSDPFYKFACTLLGCEYKPEDLTSVIELIARDVRDHPQYLNTLLVNATLVCHSITVNSYPVLELGLYGQTGEAIGIRRFEPREYLDKSINPAAGMLPNQPVYVVLEIAGVDSRAVSFEFSFL
jgi:predicted Zn finger-like uncharacterized protein